MSYETCEKYFQQLSRSSSPESLELEELECMVSHLEEFLSAHRETTRSHLVPRLAQCIVSCGLVPISTCDRDFDSRDFVSVPDRAERGFRCLKELVGAVPGLEGSGLRVFLTHCLVLCATHNQKYIWSSEEAAVLSSELLTELLKCTGHLHVGQLLCDENYRPTIFQGVLEYMRPLLMKDTWNQSASACHVFHWMLGHVKHPHLAKYLQDILPPPFMFVAYHSVQQQVIGLRCFNHILDNVPPTEIKIYSREDAIYDTLRPLTYSKELPIVRVLYPCILKLPMMQQKKDLSFWSQHDEVFHNVLLNLEMETDIELRTIFLSHVYSFIEGKPPFKHLKRILSVLDMSFSMSNDACRILSLKILKSVIQLCWPRMEYYCLQILVAILKLVSDLEEKERDDSSEKMFQSCKECLLLLRTACSETFEALVSSYIDGKDPKPGSEFLCL